MPLRSGRGIVPFGHQVEFPALPVQPGGGLSYLSQFHPCPENFSGSSIAHLERKPVFFPRMADSGSCSSYAALNAADALEHLRTAHVVEGKNILDQIRWPSLTFTEPVSFLNCFFSEIVDLPGCRFDKGLEFVGCTFAKEASFEGARIDGDCHLRACTFRESARFDRLQVNGKLEVRAPRDKCVLQNNIESGFLAHPYVTFMKDTSFSQIRVTGEANFGSAQFHGTADFYNAYIRGPAFFRIDYCKLFRETGDPSVSFPDGVFPSVRFGETETGKVLQRHPLSQEHTRARFRDVYFGSEMNFHGAIFAVKADFTYLRCQGAAFFCFSPPEDTRISCQFKAGLDFEGARFKTSLRLDEAKFSDGAVRFRDCQIAGDLGFGTLPETLVLTGCTYKRILGPSHLDLVKAIQEQDCRNGCVVKKAEEDVKNCQPSEKARLEKALIKARTVSPPFDRSSWVQFETTLRSSGDVAFADDVYRSRMRQERDVTFPPWKKLPNLLWDWVSAYGTSSLRLAICCALIFVLGFVTFDLLPLGDNPESRPNSPSSPCDSSTCAKLSPSCKWREALTISLIQFSPVKLPVEEKCRTSGPGVGFAIFEKAIAFLLVPLLLANLTGLLNRKAKASTETKSGEE
jgi:hypothetical protein